MTDNIAILGSTGSVGVNTLEVIRLHPDRYQVGALAAHSNTQLMLEQCLEFGPAQVVMVDQNAAIRLRTMLTAHGLEIEVHSGADSLEELITSALDTVVCAIVGAAGLPSTLAAVRAGARVLIANKEPVVMLGHYIMDLARRHEAVILPLDSEHNAIFQCLPGRWQQTLGVSGAKDRYGVRRMILTGSGGPFRTFEVDQLEHVTPDQACAHPNWKMGRKISVDSATMMNKGLELIEACELFGLDEQDIDIVVHPQSVVHSMVEYVDGSVLAQMANPDMKVPIANALGWPQRVESGAASLDLFAAGRFDFEPPDYDRFPALRLARNAVKQGGTAPAIMNAANEVAVEAFLRGEISFTRIMQLVTETMDKVSVSGSIDLATALEADREARQFCVSMASRDCKLAL
ncbi:MAG: 1-deoxy-D-xylulose-5-phosphate reductoisomerase [bacterium]